MIFLLFPLIKINRVSKVSYWFSQDLKPEPHDYKGLAASLSELKHASSLYLFCNLLSISFGFVLFFPGRMEFRTLIEWLSVQLCLHLLLAQVRVTLISSKQ